MSERKWSPQETMEALKDDETLGKYIIKFPPAAPVPEIDELVKAAKALLAEIDSLLDIEKRNVFGDVGCRRIENLRAALEKK